MKKVLVIVISTVLVSTGISCQNQKSLPKNTVAEKATGRIINSLTFSCAGNKTIQVLFFADKAELTLSDGRHMLLLQAISASGARYANTDESFVFWNKGNTAFIAENHKTTFKDCTATGTDQEPT
ncbi:MAG: MliC family protein [Methylococcales bacterium]|nr:MliC family protein [Methylococcales bacterium]